MADAKEWPGSPVTSRRLGLPAEEGELALLCHTSGEAGTPPDFLASQLNRRYQNQGLACEYRAFPSLTALPRGEPVLALMRFSLLLDHWVTVLDLTDHAVVVGDPLLGLQELSREEFAARWRFVGVVMRRENGPASGK